MNSLDSLLLHPQTKKQVGFFVQKPVSPLLILGERGSGKRNLAYSLASIILDLESEKQLANYPYFYHAKRPQDKQDISIDTVREVTRFMRLKTPGEPAIRRIILIEDAQYLSLEAQNALLKLLEEPNDDSLFILTAPYEFSLLPTIVSRCRHIWAYPLTIKQADGFYSDKYGSKKVESAWRLSHGSSELLKALLTDEDSHPLKLAIEQAKQFLGQPRYERLLFLGAMAKNKEEIRLFLEALAKILVALHRGAVEKGRSAQAKNLVEDRRLLHKTLRALDYNTNTRLVCLNLALNLKS